jgi:RNA polymerase sigma factor (sigma-70 family)
MTPADDRALLRQFVEQQSDAAFAALVARHVNLVYSVALRQVDAPHQAEEITQAVFIVLARKAGQLRHDRALANWLFQTTRLTAKNYMRSEIRRQRREQEAYMQSTLNEPGGDVWPRIAPLLDAAVEALGETDRRAIVLRFYEGQKLRAVGAALGTSEDAAEKRVNRALEKLRSYFGKRGIAVPAAALAAAVSAHSVQAAPPGLAAATAAALSGTLAPTAALIAATQTIAMTTLQKIAVTVALTVTIGSGLYAARLAATRQSDNQALRQQLARLQTDHQALVNEAARLKTAAASPAPVVAAAAAKPANSLALTSFEQVTNFLMSHDTGLPRAQIEAYLEQNHRNAESLLAAFQVSHDPAFLRAAATNFPGNAAVLFAVVANQVFPEDQRKWIDAFKSAAPENALPWYYSALDDFQAGHTDQAVQELNQAARRQIYGDYAAQSIQAVEEMYLSAGWPELAAAASAPGTAVNASSYLNTLKTLANDMVQLQQNYDAQGDAAAAAATASIGMELGGQLRAASLPVDEMVGISIEKKILAKLDPAQSYDFLGRPVGDVIAELDQQKQAILQALQTRDNLRPTLNAAELNNYWQREKLYGEMYAMQWLQSKYPQP